MTKLFDLCSWGRSSLSFVVLAGTLGCASTRPDPALLAACTTVPSLAPEPGLPAAGEFKLTATLRAGRVVAVEIFVVKGLPDRQTMRLAISRIEAAFRDRTICPGVAQIKADIRIGPNEAQISKVQVQSL